MAKEYVLHSELCGCERCAALADSENPRPAGEWVENPDLRPCGYCYVWSTCTCDDGD